LLNSARSNALPTDPIKPIKWQGFSNSHQIVIKTDKPQKLAKMNFRLALVIAQLGATYARSFHEVPRKWTIKALEPKFISGHVHQNRQKVVEQRPNYRLWLNSHMIRY
jgi:hypothetical protein